MCEHFEIWEWGSIVCFNHNDWLVASCCWPHFNGSNPQSFLLSHNLLMLWIIGSDQINPMSGMDKWSWKWRGLGYFCLPRSVTKFYSTFCHHHPFYLNNFRHDWLLLKPRLSRMYLVTGIPSFTLNFSTISGHWEKHIWVTNCPYVIGND